MNSPRRLAASVFALSAITFTSADAAHLAGTSVDISGRQLDPLRSIVSLGKVCLNNSGEVAYVAGLANGYKPILFSNGGLGQTGTPTARFTEGEDPGGTKLAPVTPKIETIDYFYLNNDGSLMTAMTLTQRPSVYWGTEEIARRLTPMESQTTTFTFNNFVAAFAEGTVAMAGIANNGISSMYVRGVSDHSWQWQLNGLRPNFAVAAKNLAWGGATPILGGQFGVGRDGVLPVSRLTKKSKIGFAYGVVSSAGGPYGACVETGTMTSTLYRMMPLAGGPPIAVIQNGETLSSGEVLANTPSTVLGQLSIDRDGRLYYAAKINVGTKTQSALVRTGAGLSTTSTALLKTGAAAPGLSNYLIGGITDFAVSDNGRLVVHAQLSYNGTPPAGTSALGEVLYTTTPGGPLTVFATRGDTVTSNGQTKTITGFILGHVLQNNVVVGGLPITDNGKVACVLKFGNERAVFVFNAQP